MEKEIKEIIELVKEGKMHDRIISYKNYDNRFSFPKDRIIVNVELKEGKEFSIDFSDLLKED